MEAAAPALIRVRRHASHRVVSVIRAAEFSNSIGAHSTTRKESLIEPIQAKLLRSAWRHFRPLIIRPNQSVVVVAGNWEGDLLRLVRRWGR